MIDPKDQQKVKGYVALQAKGAVAQADPNSSSCSMLHFAPFIIDILKMVLEVIF
jgi:hypothetical protein